MSSGEMSPCSVAGVGWPGANAASCTRRSKEKRLRLRNNGCRSVQFHTSNLPNALILSKHFFGESHDVLQPALAETKQTALIILRPWRCKCIFAALPKHQQIFSGPVSGPCDTSSHKFPRVRPRLIRDRRASFACMPRTVWQHVSPTAPLFVRCNRRRTTADPRVQRAALRRQKRRRRSQPPPRR